MQWIIIEDSYLDYLRKKESRIPNTDYGRNHFKPFFGTLFETDDFCYVTQVSSYKNRHNKLHKNLDFYKIYDINTSKPLAVINLNYMFPVPKNLYSYLKYKDIDRYCDFIDTDTKNNYIGLLQKEIKAINKLPLSKNALKIYELKNINPENRISQRCFDFRQLEIYAKNYTENNG